MRKRELTPIEQAAQRLRERYSSLYQLPKNKFNELVPKALWAEFNAGGIGMVERVKQLNGATEIRMIRLHKNQSKSTYQYEDRF